MLHVSGIVKGCRRTESTNRQTGEVIEKWFIGFASPKENGYDGEETVTEVQVSQKLYKAGLVAYYEKIKGQEVIAPVFLTTFAGEKKVFVNYFFSGDGKALPMIRQQKPAA